MVIMKSASVSRTGQTRCTTQVQNLSIPSDQTAWMLISSRFPSRRWTAWQHWKWIQTQEDQLMNNTIWSQQEKRRTYLWFGAVLERGVCRVAGDDKEPVKIRCERELQERSWPGFNYIYSEHSSKTNDCSPWRSSLYDAQNIQANKQRWSMILAQI